jgi:hypothetical protein
MLFQSEMNNFTRRNFISGDYNKASKIERQLTLLTPRQLK